MVKGNTASRPVKSDEYRIVLVSNSAVKGWRDICNQRPNLLADSFDFLSTTPKVRTPTNYPLRGKQLGTVVREGQSHEQWQHKPSDTWDPRIWFYVTEEGKKKTVHIVDVHTNHPNATK